MKIGTEMDYLFLPVGDAFLKEIDHFFEIYKGLEGKKTETHGWRNAERARALISNARIAFKTRQKRGQQF
jgi:inorganic pyrophosphatase